MRAGNVIDCGSRMPLPQHVITRPGLRAHVSLPFDAIALASSMPATRIGRAHRDAALPSDGSHGVFDGTYTRPGGDARHIARHIGSSPCGRFGP